MLKTPIALIIFNRPETTRRVFEAIRKIRPKQLFVIADGPRNKEEEARCRAARKITEQVDWDCKVKRNYAVKNLGCKMRPASGIDWFFEQVEEGIILEDDCLPHESFFYFCEKILAKYRNDERIMHVAGNNFSGEQHIRGANYYFSKIPFTWGWATWRRAWKYYDVNLESLPLFKKQNQIRNVFKSRIARESWLMIWDQVLKNGLDAWDYQWTYAIFSNHGLCVTPKVNLVSNIGFGKLATHTKNSASEFAEVEAGKIKKIIHPKFILPNEHLDDLTMKKHFNRSLFQIIKNKIREKI